MKTKISEQTWESIKNDYQNGISKQKISKIYKISSRRLDKFLLENNIQCKRVQYQHNDTYFDIIDTHEKAYILGFIIADGCVKLEKRKNFNFSKRIAITVSITDEQIIHYIHNVICPETKLVYTHNKKGAINRNPQITVQWTSKHMVDTLMNKYKILPRKTQDIDFEFPFEHIPDNLLGSFILGFLDGDGCVSKYTLTFVSTSKPFLIQLENIFKKFFEKNKELISEYKGHIITEHNKMTYYKYSICLGKGRKKFIKKFLYDNCPIFLQRKYDKFNI